MKINIQNYESYFLSYIDNELSSKEKKEVALFIQENPVYAHELNSLKQTVLEAEEIIFEDKVSLYRLEAMEASLPATFKKSLYREEATIVQGFFTKGRIKMVASIAAMLLLLLGYKMFFIQSPNNLIQRQSNSLVNNLGPDNKKATKAKEAAIQNSNLRIEANPVANIQQNFTVIPGANPITTSADDREAIVNETSFAQMEKTETATAYANPASASNTANNNEAAENSISINSANHAPSNGTNELLYTGDNTASMTEAEQFTNLNVDDNDRSLYIANFEIDGEKLRGISRRINAIFKRNKNEKQK
jgi:hypothetical protein